MKKLVMIGLSVSLWILLAMQAVAEQPLEIASTNFPPFVYEEQGKIKGIDVDILTEVFARMRQPISIRLYPFARAVYMIKAGQADAIFPFGKDAERELFAHYPREALFEMSVSLFVRKDSPITFNGDFKSLGSYTFGVVREAKFGEQFDAAVRDGIITQIEEVTDFHQNILKLVNNRLDIIVGPRHNILFLLKKLGQQDAVKELSPSLTPSWFVYLAFSKQRTLSPDLEERFARALQEMKRDGTYEKIIQAYIQ